MIGDIDESINLNTSELIQLLNKYKGTCHEYEQIIVDLHTQIQQWEEQSESHYNHNHNHNYNDNDNEYKNRKNEKEIEMEKEKEREKDLLISELEETVVHLDETLVITEEALVDRDRECQLLQR